MKNCMTYESREALSETELGLRRASCLDRLARMYPEAGGLLIFSAVNIYYLTGFMGTGALWLPLAGDPLLLLGKGLERARLDSPHTPSAPMPCMRDLPGIARACGLDLPGTIAADMSGLSWALADDLRAALPECVFLPGQGILSDCRAVKTARELHSLRQAGARHAKALEDLLPETICQGMSEREIAARLFGICLELGNCAISRMHNYGQEMLLGEVSAGDNCNCPTTYNGPLGFRGMHASAPYMGGNDIWKENTLLTVDTVFCYEGYNTDKTQCYFSGAEKDIPAEALEAHAFCREVERRVASRLLPGAAPSALYALSLRMAEEAGFAEGFMGLGANKVPFLGHSIGFCVDEPPVLARGFDEPLRAGMTIALEPKVGIPGFGMVGTENTWEITPDGAVCLTGGIREIRSLK